MRPALILEPSGPQGEEPGALDPCLGIGNHPLDRLEFRDGFAELDALAGVPNRAIQRSLGDPDRLGGNPNSASIKALHRDAEPVAILEETVFDRNAAVVEDQLDRIRAP